MSLDRKDVRVYFKPDVPWGVLRVHEAAPRFQPAAKEAA